VSDLRDLIDASGRPVALGREIAAGGEGVVYAVAGDAASVAKVYRRPPSEPTVAKLRWMVAHATEPLAAVAAWPTDLLFDRATRRLVGFRMADLSAFEPVHHLYNPAQRVRHFPRATWAFLARAARNLAAAFDEVHRAGVVLGDVNPTNARVSGQALVRLIDCDSFQVTADGRVYPCEVGMAHYTPPELQGIRLRGVVRTADHDRFGLAVLIFQLLVVGRHPFAGVEAGETSAEEAIARHRFAYGPQAAGLGLAAPPFTPGLDDLPPAVGELFRRAFAPGAVHRGRPSAAEWCRVLDAVAEELLACGTALSHEFWRGARGCVWCQIAARGGPDYFRPPVPDEPGFRVDEAVVLQLHRELEAAGVAVFSYSRDDYEPPVSPTPRPRSPLPPWWRWPVAVRAGLFVLGVVVVASGAALNRAGAAAACFLGVPLTAFAALWMALSPPESPTAWERRRLEKDEEEAHKSLLLLELHYRQWIANAARRQEELIARVLELLDACQRLQPEYDNASDHPFASTAIRAELIRRFRQREAILLAHAQNRIAALIHLQTSTRRELMPLEAALRTAVARWGQACADLVPYQGAGY